MGKPAVRASDLHTCPDHGAAPLGASSSTNVSTNSRPQVRCRDSFVCAGGAAKVMSGASTVTVNGEFAARVDDKTTHKGMLTVGSKNVMIGGPTGCGCPGKGGKICQAMAAGRNPPPGTVYPPNLPDPRAGQPVPPYTRKQSYNNCGIEVCRQILFQVGKRMSQEELFDDAIARGHADGDSSYRHGNGGTDYVRMMRLLGDYGVTTMATHNREDTIAQGVAEGKGVIAAVYYGILQNDSRMKMIWAQHAVLVTGIEYDQQGTMIAVFINDTGLGTCAQKVNAISFRNALIAPQRGAAAVITKDPIW